MPLIAAAVSIAETLWHGVNLAVGLVSGRSLFNALAILPPVSVFVGALRLPHRLRGKSLIIRAVAKQWLPLIDLAYGYFASIALVLCAVPVMSLLPLDVSTFQVLGMVIGIPVVLATLVAGLAPVVLSMVEWRVWPLVTC